MQLKRSDATLGVRAAADKLYPYRWRRALPHLSSKKVGFNGRNGRDRDRSGVLGPRWR